MNRGYGLTKEQSEALTEEPEIADYYEEVIDEWERKHGGKVNTKLAANFVINNIIPMFKRHRRGIV